MNSILASDAASVLRLRLCGGALPRLYGIGTMKSRTLALISSASYAQLPDSHGRNGAAGRSITTSSVAVDATGLASGAINTFFVRRCQQHTGQPRLWKQWLKWLITIDTDQQIILAQLVSNFFTYGPTLFLHFLRLFRSFSNQLEKSDACKGA